MSGAQNVGFTLPGSTKNTAALRECSKCGGMAEPSGGIDRGAGRWWCAKCWRGFAASPARRRQAGKAC